ncbi:MAG: hypothetical protein P4L84_01215 [Isosphaeraceae bacterium]|nr:hypothetical protein [Isosphaeraceae bacterium]
MRQFLALSFGLAMIPVFTSHVGANPVELSIQGGYSIESQDGSPVAGDTNAQTYQISDGLQSGQFLVSERVNGIERPPSGWGSPSVGEPPTWVPFSEPVSGSFGMNLYFTPPASTPQQPWLEALAGMPPVPNAPWINISGNLSGAVAGDDTSDIGAILTVSNLSIRTANWAGSGLPPSLLSAFTDPNRIRIVADVTGGFMNEFEFQLDILPPGSPTGPQSVPEPQTFATFAALAAGLVIWCRRGPRTSTGHC